MSAAARPAQGSSFKNTVIVMCDFFTLPSVFDVDLENNCDCE